MKIYSSSILFIVSLTIRLTLLSAKTTNSKSLGNNLWRNATQRTVGSVIPWPRKINFLNDLDYLVIDPLEFDIVLSDQIKKCNIVRRAIDRYNKNFLFDDIKPSDKDDPHSGQRKKLGSLKELSMNQDSRSDFICESMPYDNMDEAYSLEIVILGGDKPKAQLNSQTTWGLIRGLETFSQLVFNIAPNLYAVQTVVIKDNPRFKHRGFMVDTARHYISMSKIIDLLDAMAFNKMNVLHWHLVDDQSFPYESSTYPQLSLKTSFRPNMVYTKHDVNFAIRYAADRGIRVIPELDTPGHTYALRYVPKFLTKCYNNITKEPNGDFGPVDPTKIENYRSMIKLVYELGSVFHDSYFHAGGDEVDFDCWKSNPEINKWMEERNMSDNFQELNNFYIRRIYDILAHFNKTMIVWQEVFDNGAYLPKDAIIHVWKNINEKPAFMKEMKNVVSAGYKAILSSCWYLNYIDYGQDWIKFYQCDPASDPIKEEDEHMVLGGEVCMWTEYVDDSNVVTRTWPRASAAAERLWSSKTMTNVGEFLNRLEQMRCRLLFRGIQAEPVNGPGYC